MEQYGKRCNGWTNYETWAVALWFDNDQQTQSFWREVARSCRREAREDGCLRDSVLTAEEAACSMLANRMKEEVRDGTPVTSEASIYADLLMSALAAVDWHEIAGHYLDGLDD